MTAVIGILNKEGAAIAADSAVTVSNYRGEKILNSANKMIRLSEVAPIGVMICSNACAHRGTSSLDGTAPKGGNRNSLR